MIIYSYNVLTGLLEEMQQELQELDKQIENNLLCIKEADIYIKGFRDAESEDFKVFSPINKEIIHKDEIKRASEKKADCEEKNKSLIHKREMISSRIKKLKSVLNRESHDLSVIRIQEEDRKRIAGELHDTSLQNLTHLIHKIELSSMYIDTDPIQAKLELSVINKGLKEIIDEIRGTIFDLRPMSFDDLGMKAALERLIATVNENGKFEIDYEIDDVSCETKLVMVSIYRIVKEAFNNIVRHAEAKKIIFRFKNRDGKCIIEIEDDGKGFEENHIDGKKHFGVSLMRERVELLNGKVTITSKENSGTKIYVEIPLNGFLDAAFDAAE